MRSPVRLLAVPIYANYYESGQVVHTRLFITVQYNLLLGKQRDVVKIGR